MVDAKSKFEVLGARFGRMSVYEVENAIWLVEDGRIEGMKDELGLQGYSKSNIVHRNSYLEKCIGWTMDKWETKLSGSCCLVLRDQPPSGLIAQLVRAHA